MSAPRAEAASCDGAASAGDGDDGDEHHHPLPPPSESDDLPPPALWSELGALVAHAAHSELPSRVRQQIARGVRSGNFWWVLHAHAALVKHERGGSGGDWGYDDSNESAAAGSPSPTTTSKASSSPRGGGVVFADGLDGVVVVGGGVGPSSTTDDNGGSRRPDNGNGERDSSPLDLKAAAVRAAVHSRLVMTCHIRISSLNN